MKSFKNGSKSTFSRLFLVDLLSLSYLYCFVRAFHIEENINKQELNALISAFLSLHFVCRTVRSPDVSLALLKNLHQSSSTHEPV